jgi:hypothetical protein
MFAKTLFAILSVTGFAAATAVPLRDRGVGNDPVTIIKTVIVPYTTTATPIPAVTHTIYERSTINTTKTLLYTATTTTTVTSIHDVPAVTVTPLTVHTTVILPKTRDTEADDATVTLTLTAGPTILYVAVVLPTP